MAAGYFRIIITTTAGAIIWGARKNAAKVARAGKAVIGGAGALLAAAPLVLKHDPDELTVDVNQYMAQPINDVPTLEHSKQIKHRMEVLCIDLQGKLCKELERIEGTTKFKVDRWLKCGNRVRGKTTTAEADDACHDRVWDSSGFPMDLYAVTGHDHFFEGEEGGGITCVMEDGAIFERAGVNISVISGRLRPAAIKHMNATNKDRKMPEDEDVQFNAVGISSVIHPRNPHIPTMHFNYRYFEVNPEMSEGKWWFGGGSDLTPYYYNLRDFKHFHCTYKSACDMHGPTYYKRFKKWADDYFYLSHRCLRRGIGGIFFDDFRASGVPENAFGFVKACADTVIPAYIPIVQLHKNDVYGIKERDWQLYRRGQYVEFNLIWDRGTKFGFSTPGSRIESILVSMPPKCAWKYCYEPEAGTEEAKLMEVLRKPVEWTEM